MLKKSHYIALGVVAVVALIILNLPTRTTAHLKLAIGSLFLPLFGLTGASQQLAGKSSESLLPRSELARENESLLRENQQLHIQARQSEELARENVRLRQFYNWKNPTPWKSRLANVVLREPANWWRAVWIDLGSLNGARENLPVLAPDGCLVGRIARVGQTRSQVVLVGDPGCKVAALIENDKRDNGIVGVGGPLDSSLVEMNYLPPNANLKPGQLVTTSGLGDVFPKGIPIGQIVDAHTVDYGLSSEARVRLAANLGSLEEVWVLFP